MSLPSTTCLVVVNPTAEVRRALTNCVQLYFNLSLADRQHTMRINKPFELPCVLRYHLRLFQLFGLHTLSLRIEVAQPRADSQRSQPSRVEQLLPGWSLLLFVSLSTIAIGVFCIEDEFAFGGDRFGNFNDQLKYVFAEMAVVAIYMEALFKRKALRRFWQLYAALQAASARQEAGGAWCSSAQARPGWLAQMRQHARFLFAFYAIGLTELSLFIVFWRCQHITRHLFLFWVTFQPFIGVVHMRNMQFILHMELIRQQLAQLQHELALLVAYANFATVSASFAGFEDFLRRKLLQKQFYYQHIYQLFVHFQNAFGCSILAVLLMIYVRVLVDFYFMYYAIYHEQGNYDLWLIIPTVMEIPALIYASQSCANVIKRITYQLHNVVHNNMQSISITVQIQNFSLQILHSNIRFDVMGFSALDGYMLTRALGSVTSFMIFFIQFMPKFSNQEIVL